MDYPHTIMGDNREKKIEESYMTLPSTRPLNVVIMPTTSTVGQQQTLLKDNRISKPIRTYSSHSTAKQTNPKPVRLVMMAPPSTPDQQLPSMNSAKQSEREVFLVPHAVGKQSKTSSSLSGQVTQHPKKVQGTIIRTAPRLTSYNINRKVHYTGTRGDASNPYSILQTASPKYDQQLPCTSSAKQSERKVFLVPHAVVKQSKNASLLPGQVNQPPKKVQETIIGTAQRLTSNNTNRYVHYTGTRDDASNSYSILQSASPIDDQQLPCTSSAKQSERKVFLVPHAVVKQSKKASFLSGQVNQPPKKVQETIIGTAQRLTSNNTNRYVRYTGTRDDASNSYSVLQSASPKDDQLHSVESSVGGIEVTALQESHIAIKQENVPSALLSKDQLHSVESSVGGIEVTALQESPIAIKQENVPSALLSKESQNIHVTDTENDSEITQSSHSYINQSEATSKQLSGTNLTLEAQQCENVNSSKDSRLKEEHTYDCPESRPGFVPPHLIVMTVPPKEINHRIKSFLARKQAELDIQNVEEYCLHIGTNPNVCARVDATVHQRRQRKRRKFELVPHPEEEAESTQFMSNISLQEPLPLSVTHPILEERVANAENHLSLGKPVPKDIYSRLKRIEDRILLLEGISPEYAYDPRASIHRPRPLPKLKRRCTNDEIDAKITELQQKFAKKPDASNQKETVK